MVHGRWLRSPPAQHYQLTHTPALRAGLSPFCAVTMIFALPFIALLMLFIVSFPRLAKFLFSLLLLAVIFIIAFPPS